jgi:hypothetical protein
VDAGPPTDWVINEHEECFIVRDATGQALGYFYYDDEPSCRSVNRVRPNQDAHEYELVPLCLTSENARRLRGSAGFIVTGRPTSTGAGSHRSTQRIIGSPSYAHSIPTSTAWCRQIKNLLVHDQP